ncbi:MAG: hypothetical protein ACTSU4_03565 [Promethearchaeota archaeon]
MIRKNKNLQYISLEKRVEQSFQEELLKILVSFNSLNNNEDKMEESDTSSNNLPDDVKKTLMQEYFQLI